MADPNDKVMSFDSDFETGSTIGKEIGRIYLGNGAAIARLRLFPDGIHLMVDNDPRFVHPVERDRMRISNLGTLDAPATTTNEPT